MQCPLHNVSCSSSWIASTTSVYSSLPNSNGFSFLFSNGVRFVAHRALTPARGLCCAKLFRDSTSVFRIPFHEATGFSRGNPLGRIGWGLFLSTMGKGQRWFSSMVKTRVSNLLQRVVLGPRFQEAEPDCLTVSENDNSMSVPFQASQL